MDEVTLNGTFQASPLWPEMAEMLRQCGLAFWRLTLIDDSRLGIEVNDNFLSIFGHDRDEFPRDFNEFLSHYIHPDDQYNVLAVLSEAFHGPDKDARIECRVFNPAIGQWRWMRSVGLPGPRDHNGRAEVILGCLQEMHEFYTALGDLKKVHSALHQERERLAAIIDAADIVVWDWNLITNERIYGPASNFCDPRLNDFSENSRDVWKQILSEQDRSRIMAAALRHVRGETAMYEVEYQIERPDGSPLWIQDRGRVVERGADGRALRMLGMMVDITSRRSTEKSLAEQNEQMELIIAASKVGTWDWYVQRDWMTFNSAYCLMLGYEPGELDGNAEKWRSYVHPDDVGKVARHFTEVFVGPGLTYESTLRMRHKKGYYVVTHDVGRVVDINREGQAVRIVGVQMGLDEVLKI